MISETLLRQLGYSARLEPLGRSNPRLVTVTNDPIPVFGRYRIRVKIEDSNGLAEQQLVEFLVADMAVGYVIGFPWLQEVNPQIN